MNRDSRQQINRPRTRRAKARVGLESLETRQLLSGGGGQLNPDLIPSLLFNRSSTNFPVVARPHPIGDSPGLQTLLDNDGKVLIGQLPNGDQFSITVTGPGVAIVTDVTPNDGLLNSEIDTIQLVGTDPHRTRVTGQVKSSDRVISDGLVGFNRLLATEGVASIELNGFVLRETGEIPTGPPRIALLGGVKSLSFYAIEAAVNPEANQPVDVIIGDPSTPLRVRPNIQIGHIFNTAFDPAVGPINNVPQTDPTVRLIVNGDIHRLELGSVTANVVPADINAILSPVSYTGRTNVEARGVEGMKVVGSARNLVLARGDQPFTNRFSGLDRVGHAYFGGPADAVAIDATGGRIGQLKFLRGLGNPANTTPSLLEGGNPIGKRGYPASGLAGGVIAANEIGSTTFGPANLVRQVPPDPRTIQYGGPGTINYVTRPGFAQTNVTMTANRAIGDTTIVGDSLNTLVAAGFDYLSFRQGLDPIRQPSRIGFYQQRGDLVDSVIAASYRPTDGVYGTPTDQAGNGTIAGRFTGNLFRITGDEAFAPPTGPTRVQGAGFFARRLIGDLPSIGGPQAEGPRRVHSILNRL
jgi:hypothetical protein